MHVAGMSAAAVIHFFLHPTDDLYQHWWPGTHHSLHPLNGEIGVGQVVYMDELVASRRLRFAGIVTDLGPDRITWQFHGLVTLPCWLSLRIVDDEAGATITHTIRAGYRGALGRLLDPLLRLYLSPGFACMMEEHFKTEFAILPQVLEREGGPSV
ncbi:MAG: hypothetical protein ACYDHQ_06585 [Coriobacteriia bacterium]